MANKLILLVDLAPQGVERNPTGQTLWAQIQNFGQSRGPAGSEAVDIPIKRAME
jgi:hypothetical protein